MNYQYQETRSVDDLDEPYPNSALQFLDPQFVQEILPEDDPEPITAPKPTDIRSINGPRAKTETAR